MEDAFKRWKEQYYLPVKVELHPTNAIRLKMGWKEWREEIGKKRMRGIAILCKKR